MASWQVRQRDPLLDQGTQAMLERRGRELIGLALIGLALIFAAILGTYSPDDPGWMVATDAPANNMLGRFGAAVSSTLVILIGNGAWAVPAILAAWGLRFTLHRGGERALSRMVFAVIAVALASAWCSTLSAPSTWAHTFGLGGLFGDTVAGTLIGILPGGSGFGLKLLSLITFFAMCVMLGYVMGFDRVELRQISRGLTDMAVRLYVMVLNLGGKGASSALGGAMTGARAIAERGRRARSHAVETWGTSEDDDWSPVEPVMHAQHRSQPQMLAEAPRAATAGQGGRMVVRRAPEPDTEMPAPGFASMAAPPMTASAMPRPRAPVVQQEMAFEGQREAAADYRPAPLAAEPAWNAPATLRAEPRRFDARPEELPREKLGFLARMRRVVEPEPELVSPELSDTAMASEAPSDDRIKARISDAIRARGRPAPGTDKSKSMTPLQAAIAARRAEPPVRRGTPGPATRMASLPNAAQAALGVATATASSAFAAVAAPLTASAPPQPSLRMSEPPLTAAQAIREAEEMEFAAQDDSWNDTPVEGWDADGWNYEAEPDPAPWPRLEAPIEQALPQELYAAPVAQQPHAEPAGRRVVLQRSPVSNVFAEPRGQTAERADAAREEAGRDATEAFEPAPPVARTALIREPQLTRTPPAPTPADDAWYAGAAGDDVEWLPDEAFDDGFDEDLDAPMPHGMRPPGPPPRIVATPPSHPSAPRIAPALDRRTMPSAPAPAAAPAAAPMAAVPRRYEEAMAHDYELPPLSLLASAAGIQRNQLSDEALEENARMLEAVLEDYGVKGEIVSVRPGPVVTMYELEPAPGLKASRVIGLAEDIARSMSALTARVSTVPGRTVIGIELPNAMREKVFLREILAAREFGDGQQRLPLALGKDIGGAPIVANLAKMPHLLIAGTTGSGKSVAINTMILSLLYKLTPEECRLIMIDPKMLELSVYDGIPHLLSPVVTDPKKAVVALKWVVGEMEERYRKMSKMGVRNIEGYNGRVREALAKGEMFKRTIQTGFDDETGDPVFETDEFSPQPFPYIVVVVDEMADLMMVAGKEIEACIQRLAQMARASGIHLIMATQRPSVDVITGTIKANFPTRISFQVTSKIDSRTILGEMGAEQLLGQGDMLYMGNGQRITRIHGPFVSDEEVEEIVNHLKSFGPPSYMSGVVDGPEEGKADDIDAVLGLNTGGNTEGEDALYDQAVAIVARDRKCSTSYIQRKLGIGYNKAARLVEQMEEEGVVTPANHVGKREILIPEN